MLRAGPVAALVLVATIGAATAKSYEPCALITVSSERQLAKNPHARASVDASLAYKCLNSVPLGKQAAIDLVDAIVPYSEWQSDAAYKANPPPDYFFPPVDIYAQLSRIKAALQADQYANEYEFQADLFMNVTGAAHDGHFAVYTDLLTGVFGFHRQHALVSISEDGSSLPVIKVYDDVVANPATASVVTQINGQDAVTYVGDAAFSTTFNQDADAAYNTMFWSKALNGVAGSSGGFYGGTRANYIYRGPNTTLTFENGTTLVTLNKATVKVNMTGVVNGQTFYQKFCDPATSIFAAPGSGSHATAPAGPNIPGYPSPLLASTDMTISGYYLDGTGYEDVAVLVVETFETESPPEFQKTAQQFFAKAKADGKTKLVVDLQVNNGGYIVLGVDLFRQLFPHIVQDGFSRWKETDAFMALSQIASQASANIDPYTDPSPFDVEMYASAFNWRTDLNLTNQPFTSFEDKFNPHVFQNTPYTNIMRWDLNSSFITTNATYGPGIEITGYGSLANAVQPFETDNIVVLLDGICSSTCTLFAGYLRNQAGVRSVMVGGRPIEGLIQGVGGVKGATALTFDDIYAFTAHFQSAASTDAQKAALSRYSDLPMKRSIYAGVNAKDLILRSHLNDGLPAQFVVEKADCRLYHTQAMVADITAMWKATADAGFRGAKCAAGAISPGRGRKPRAAKRTDAVVHRAVVGNGQPGKLVELPQFQASHHVAIGI